MFVCVGVRVRVHVHVRVCVCVTGFRKTDPNRTFDISRITNLKYLTHCESLLLGCSHAKFAVAIATIVI